MPDGSLAGMVGMSRLTRQISLWLRPAKGFGAREARMCRGIARALLAEGYTIIFTLDEGVGERWARFLGAKEIGGGLWQLH